MAESNETRHLSGLARSIDALFGSSAPATKAKLAPPTIITPPVTAEAAPPAVEPAWAEARAEDTIITPLPAGAPVAEEHGDMFPASQMLPALPAAAWFAAHAPAPPAPVTEPEPALDLGPAHEEPAPERARVLDEPPAPARAALTDPHELDDALREFLAGEAGARGRIEGLAPKLQERLALDPLADAVETLVREAGIPPDARYIDLAGRVINPAVASRIVQRLGQESDETRREEYFALGRRMGRVMANALKGALTGALDKDVRRIYHDALISMGEASRPVIEGMVGDDNRFLVRDGVAILGEIGGPRAVELVTAALADTDPRVRSEALLALGKLKHAEAGQLVLGSLEDADPNVRVAAAVAAGEIGVERALRPLLQMLEEEQSSETHMAVLRALGQLGDPGAVHAIEKHAVPTLLSKPRTEVRVAAYRALFAIGTPHARELIAKAAQDKDPVVRVALRDLTRGD
jgi:HEAT repeat protein